MERGYTWRLRRRVLNLAMSRALIINLTNASNFLIDIKPVKDLYYETAFTSGVILFFDKEYNMIMFGSSIDDICELSKDLEPEDASYYHIIKDENVPLNEREIDNIYEGILQDKFSIHIVNHEEQIHATICLN